MARALVHAKARPERKLQRATQMIVALVRHSLERTRRLQ